MSLTFLLWGFCLIAEGQSPVAYKHSEGSSAQLSLTDTEHGNITLNYTAGDITIRELSLNEGRFWSVEIAGHHYFSDPGKPMLPVISRLVEVPENSGYSVSYSNIVTKTFTTSEIGIDGFMVPSQPGRTKSQDRTDQRFVYDREFYSRDKFTDYDTITIEHIGVMRGRRLATISLMPVRYNPTGNIIEVIVSMNIDISFKTTGGKATGFTGETAMPLLSYPDKGSVKSFSPEQLINGYRSDPIGMVILSDTIFREQLDQLVRWKTRKGFRVSVLYRGGDYAGTTFTQLRDTIKSLYLNPPPGHSPPDYLLIFGSLDHIPRSEGTSQLTDLYYAEFTGGGDYLPEMFIGRLPVRDTSEARGIVEKIIEYETFAFADTNTFYRNALITAGDDNGWQQYMNGHVNYATSYYLKSDNNINTTSFNYPASVSKADSIKSLLNSGISFLNYTGHGGTTRWEGPSISSSDIEQLTNQSMYPFVISNSCQTGNFAATNNFATTFVLSKNKGAIGFIGCTNDAYWAEDYYWAVGAGTVMLDPEYVDGEFGVYDRLFHLNGELPSDWFYTMGQINFAGNLAVSASTTHRKRYYWETYSLIGDPSLIPIIGEPEEIDAEIPDTITIGSSKLYIETTPFLYAAISAGDSLWDASFVSPSGFVSLKIPENHGDSCLLVITGQNRKPVIKTVYFSVSDGPSVEINSFIVDDSGSNNNGMAETGETFFAGILLKNIGGEIAASSYLKLESSSEWINISRDSLYIGDILPGGLFTTGDEFEITAGSPVPDLGIATVKITVGGNGFEYSQMHDLVLHAPDLALLSMVVDDTNSGNGNFAADRGETVDLVFSVANRGTGGTNGTLRVMNTPDWIMLHNYFLPTGYIAPGEVTEIILQATVSEQAIPGTEIVIEVMIDCGDYFDYQTFQLKIGLTRESFEHGRLDIFPWINDSEVPWIITSTDAFDGLLSARSGPIDHRGLTALQITITIPESDSLSFWYRVSSERNYDFFRFKINDQQIASGSGEVEWTRFVVLLPEGTHTLEWSYSKDVTVSHGHDCAWIDMIDFPASAFLARDIELLSIISPTPELSGESEEVSVLVRNNGMGIINEFNLAWTINNRYPHFTQLFNTTLLPGESTVVTFSQAADLSRYGIYNLLVYGFNNNDEYPYNDTLRLSFDQVISNSIIRAYPNPFTENITFSVISPENDRVEIIISDITGRRVYSVTRLLINGDNQLVMNLSHLETGIYIVNITGEKTRERFRIIKR